MPRNTHNTIEKTLSRLVELSKKGNKISVEDARILISDITKVTKHVLVSGGFPERDVTRLTTKLRDAGRRSPPWTPHSNRVPGRPQDGADGNRRLRWLFPIDHKFYADEITATLVEVKYYLQVLSMTNAPYLPENTIRFTSNLKGIEIQLPEPFTKAAENKQDANLQITFGGDDPPGAP